jgi:hypothetical protein
MLAPDAFQSAVAEREIELANQAAGPEGKQLLPQSDPLLLDLGAGLVGVMMRSSGEFDQTTRSLLLETAQPFADRERGGLEEASRGLDAPLSSRLDQTQAMIVGVSHLPNQYEVSGGHSGL